MSKSLHDGVEEVAGLWRPRISWLIGLLTLAAVMLVVSRFAEIERFVEIARATEPAWLLVAIILQTLTYVCAAGVWYVTLRRAGIAQNFLSILPLGLAKLFADQVLPTGGIGGALLVISGLSRRGIPNGIAMAALLVGLVSYYIAYLLAVIAALTVLYASYILDPLIVAATIVFVLIAFGIPTSVLALRYWSKRHASDSLFATVYRWLNRVPGLSALIRAMVESPALLLRDHVAFVSATILQLLVFVLDVTTLWIMLQAIGADKAPVVAMAAFVMASLVATIGPMPLGLGTFEAVCVTILHIQGLSVEIALTATLLMRGFTFWLPMIPGLVLARRELRPPDQHMKSSKLE